MTVTLTFHGAVGTVTGAAFRLDHPGGSLLVDCGLFQGSKTVRALNYAALPFAPGDIEAVLLTHAHIDHSGLLPKLVRGGFAGRILTTAGSRDLLTCLLPDTAYIQETEVERLNRRNRQRGVPAVEPIYVAADAARCLELVEPIAYGRWLAVMPGVRARFWNAGHILGSASVEVEVEGEAGEPLRLLFSGDIGPTHKLFHPDPEAPTGFDYVVVEATYGDTDRVDLTAADRRRVLQGEVEAALARGGNILIPCFAVERTQELLLDLTTLVAEGALPRRPIFLDSPLAIRATEIFAAHAPALEDVPARHDPFAAGLVRFTESVEASKAIDRIGGGAVILAGSGMCDAGRIRHHLKRHLWRPEATVLMVGYQAPGTLGALLLEGKRRVRIHGEEVQVKAAIRYLDAYSGHADAEGLAAWVLERRPIRRGLFLVHGEDGARAALRDRLSIAGLPRRRLHLPGLDERYVLDGPAAPRRLAPAAPRLAGPPPRLDWHNEYAQMVLDMRRALAAAPDDEARKALLRRLRRAVGALPPNGGPPAAG